MTSNKECSTKFTKNELIVTLINVPTFLWTQFITQTFVKMWDQMSSKSAIKWEPNENHIVKMWEKMRFEWKLHCQNVGKEWDSNENYIVKMWVQMRMQMRMEWILHHFVPIFSPWKTEPTRTKWCKKIHICQPNAIHFCSSPHNPAQNITTESPCKIRGWSLMLKVFYIIQFSSTHHNLHSINLWKQAAFYMSKVIGWNIIWWV
jgi:hypothetical protein